MRVYACVCVRVVERMCARACASKKMARPRSSPLHVPAPRLLCEYIIITSNRNVSRNESVCEVGYDRETTFFCLLHLMTQGVMAVSVMVMAIVAVAEAVVVV